MRCKLYVFIVVVLAIGSIGQAAPPVHVKATLLADVKQIIPGKPFSLGVLLEIDPGWHIYWLNPGDSGLATKITLQLPKGFTAGEVQFPTPIKIVDPGNIKVFGYTDKVMFIATVMPDKSVAPGQANLSAAVIYLACKDDCIPGKASPELKLPIGPSTAKAQADHNHLFIKCLAEIPVPPEQNTDVNEVKQLYDPAKHTVQLRVGLAPHVSEIPADNTVLEVFPAPNDDVNIKSDVSYSESGCAVTLQVLPLKGHPMPSTKLLIILGYNDGAENHRRGVITEIDLSKLRTDTKAVKN